jgi:hypothetical protein
MCVPESTGKESRIGLLANADATPQEDEALIIRRVRNNTSLCGRFPPWSQSRTKQRRQSTMIQFLAIYALQRVVPSAHYTVECGRCYYAAQQKLIPLEQKPQKAQGRNRALAQGQCRRNPSRGWSVDHPASSK